MSHLFGRSSVDQARLGESAIMQSAPTAALASFVLIAAATSGVVNQSLPWKHY